MGSNAIDKEKYRFGDKFVEKIIRRIAHNNVLLIFHCFINFFTLKTLDFKTPN